MKFNTNKLLFILGIAAVITSCDSKLDIQPKTAIDATTALKTSKDVKAVLIGAYAQMGSSNLYGGGIQVYTDLLASGGDDIVFFGTFQGLTQISNKDIPINNSFITSVWTDAYSVINSTNIVLENIALVDSVDQLEVAAEAKFIRGSMYFELVKLFARAYNDGDPAVNPGVPLVLSSTKTVEDAEKTPARATVDAVYQQVLLDLLDAKADLPEQPSLTYYYATTGSASAQLSRVYLTQLDYVSALAEANAIIESGDYALVSDYSQEFPFPGSAVRTFNTTEDLYAQQVSEQSGTNSQNTYYALPSLGGRGDIEVTEDYVLDNYESNDIRLSLLEDDGTGTYYIHKFDNLYGNVKIIRLAEIYLTRAECNLRLDDNVGASPQEDINVVRERVGLDPFDSDPTLDDVLHERHIELANEGQWLADYKRTTATLDTTTPTPWDSPLLIFPIPQREIQINKALVQNEGYGN